jgi:hypothetical protein
MRPWASHLALLAIAACGANVAIAAESQPAVFSIGGKTYSIALPEKAVIRNMAANGVSIDDLSKSQRLERSLIISLAPNEAGSAIDRVEKLRRGNILAYQTADDIGGGSGGPVAELIGRITVDDAQLFVTCTDQDEWSRDPKWCMPLLESLQRAPPQ